MKKLKETAYNTAELLFDDAYDFLGANLCEGIFRRWKNYEICMDDEEEWHDFFITKSYEVGEIAKVIIADASQTDTAFLTYHDESTSYTTAGTEDNTRIETNADSVQAQSGYDNNQMGSTDKNLDTPQGNISNLDDGYLTSANKSQGTNNNANLSTNSQSSGTVTEHSGGISTSNDGETSRDGFNGERPQLIDRYLQIMPGIVKRISDLWSECFVLFFEEV